MKGVLPCGLAMCGCGLVGMVEVVPEAFHVVLDVCGVSVTISLARSIIDDLVFSSSTAGLYNMINQGS